MQMEAEMLSGAQACAESDSCMNVLRAASSSLGPAHFGTTCSTPKNSHSFFSVSPITVQTTTGISLSLALDFQYRNTSNPLSLGKERSSRIKSGGFLVPSTTSCKNRIAAAILFSAMMSSPPSFLTTAVDCLTSDGVSSTIKTRCIMVSRAGVVSAFSFLQSYFFQRHENSK